MAGKLTYPEQNSTQIATFGGSYVFGAFQLCPTDHHGGGGTDFYMDDGVKWYGVVPGAAIAFAPGTRSRLAVDGITVVCPGSAVPGGSVVGQVFLNLGGLFNNEVLVCNLSDVPIFDLQSGSSVAGHQ
jgi:hypothetical protein